MKGLTKPDNFVTSADKRLVVVCGLVAILAIYGPLGAVPLPVGVIMLCIPIFIYFGVLINQQHKFDDLVRERRARINTEKPKKILYRSRFRSEEEGTVWEITNANPFNWTNTKMLIEREHGSEKVTEKFYLGDIPSGTKATHVSNIVDIETARWRVLIISNEGQLVEFPERWKNNHWFTPSLIENN